MKIWMIGRSPISGNHPISKSGFYGSQTCSQKDWHMFVGCPLNVEIHLFTTFSLILSLGIEGSAAVNIVAVSSIGHESNLKSQRGPVDARRKHSGERAFERVGISYTGNITGWSSHSRMVPHGGLADDDVWVRRNPCRCRILDVDPDTAVSNPCWRITYRRPDMIMKEHDYDDPQ